MCWKTPEEVQISLQHYLNCALEWFMANRLHFNVKKTKWSLIGTYQKPGKATEISIFVNGEQLERVDEYIIKTSLFRHFYNKNGKKYIFIKWIS